METLLMDIGQIGFPVAMCVYLLIERDKTTNQLLKEIKAYTTAITELTIIIKERLK